MQKRFIGIQELAEYLDISINTARTWVWQRQIPYHKLGRLVKFDIIELNEWLKDRKVKELN